MIGAPARTGMATLGLAWLLSISSGMAAEAERRATAPVPAKVWRYAERWFARGDADGDGKLTAKEWPQPTGGAVDADQDGLVTVEELAQHIADFGRHRRIRLMPASAGGLLPLPSLLPPGVAGAEGPATLGEADGSQSPNNAPADTVDEAQSGSKERASDRKYFVPPSRLPPGLPDWFLKRDADGDGQLTLSEYAESGSASADKEFARYDRNRDGLVTPHEVVGGSAKTIRAKPPPAKDSAPQPPPADATPPPPAADAEAKPPPGTDSAPQPSPAADAEAKPPPSTDFAPKPPAATDSAPEPEKPSSGRRSRKRSDGD